MRLDRRHFVGLAAALLVAPRLAVAEEAADGFIELRARKMVLGLLDGGAGKADCWIMGEGPEPAVIRARQGEELRLRFINELDAEIWLHFHGVRGPSELMTLNIPPGTENAADCVFSPPDAGTFWIAPVARQSETRDRGLHAMLIVAEAEPPEGIADLPLVLDDWKLDDAGTLAEGFGDVEAMVGEGRLGNWFTINNRFRPRLPLEPGRYTRLRILNAANVRSMGLLFKGSDPLLIARDGQPQQPQMLGNGALTLAPGQRADLLVSPAEGGIRLALDLFEDVVEIGYLVADPPTQPAPIAENFALPPNPVANPGPLAEAATFSIRIEGGLTGGLSSAVLGGVERDLRTLLENGKGWAFNGVAGPAAEPMFTFRQGQTVLLEIDNRTAFAQPLHIHGHVWQEVDEAPTGVWSDTAVIAPSETVTLMFVADNPGTWAIQSLVAERADGGLFAAFTIEAGDGNQTQPEL